MRDSPHPSDVADIRYFARVARRRFGTVLVLAVLLPAASLAVASIQAPVYAASSEVLVKREDLAASLTDSQPPYIDGPTAERLIETQIELARVPGLVARVLDAAGARAQTPEDFLRSSSVEAKPNTDILVLTVERSTPAQAIHLAGIYADEFSQYRRQLDRTELDAVADEVRRQLAPMDTPEGRDTPLWADLDGRLRQIRTLQALQTASAVVVRRADSAQQTGPKAMSVGAGGLVLGLILGVGVAFLRETLDDRVRTSREVVDRLGLPLLGRLPPPPRHLSDGLGLLTLAHPDSQHAEPFSFLRTSLNFANRHPVAEVIMVSSGAEEEGKSTTVANLAVALAQAGSRVALVDLDLRRPAIHRLFRVRQTPGLADVATGSAELDDALVEVAVNPMPPDGERGRSRPLPSSLHVLPAGRERSGTDLGALVAVVDHLRSRADLVLVDASPLLRGGEALALCARMDALVVVARLNEVRRPVLDEVRRTLDAAPVRALGVVCTGEDDERSFAHRSRHRAQCWEVEEKPTIPRPMVSLSRDSALVVGQRSPSNRRSDGPAMPAE